MGGSPSKNQQIIQSNEPVSIKENFTIFGSTAKGPTILKYSPGKITVNPSPIKFPKYAHCFMGSGKYAYMTGGVEELQSTSAELKSADQQEYEGLISKKFYQISVSIIMRNPQNQQPKQKTQDNNTVIREQPFKQMPEMINARYSHCAVEKLGNIFVMGGREYGDDEIGILAACQKFIANENKWKPLPTLRYPRSGAAAVLYGEFIYVFGGYTGKGERSRVIESYREGDSSWKQLPYRLHEGIEGFLVVGNPISSASIYIFGGKTDAGKTKSVFEINFDKASVNYCTPMEEERCFHKGYIFDKKIHLIGGGTQNIEIYDLLEHYSVVDPEFSFLDYCNSKQLNSAVSLESQITLTYTKKPYVSPTYQQKLFVFGHAKEPFTKIMDIEKLIVISEAQSLHHNFYKFQTVIKVNKQTCFVMGGLSADHNKVSSMAYSINLQTEQIKYLQSMKTAKYGFTGAVKGSYLYIVGGRKLGGDQIAILSSCERFSFQTYKWEALAPLKHKRHSALVAVVKGWLVVIGGYKGGGVRSNDVEMYIQDDNRWVQIEQRFEMASEAMSSITYKDEIFIFGGRVGETDIKKVFKFHITLNQGMKFQKSITMGLEAVGNLSYPGNNLRIFLDSQKGLAYIFGNVPNGIDIYDMKKNRVVQMEKLPVFQHLLDSLFTSYSIVF